MNKTKEEFKELAFDVLPLIEQMKEVLKKHNVECLASVTLKTDGYFVFNHHDTDWDMCRLPDDGKVIVGCRFREELILKGSEEKQI